MKGIEPNIRPAVIYKQCVTLKVRLNENVVGFTELDKRERMISLLRDVLEVTSYIL